MSSFLGGFAGGLASGINAKKEKENNRVLKGIGDALSRKVPATKDDNANDITGGSSDISVAHKGGRIKKTGVYRMKEGEVVIPANIVRAMDKKLSRKPSRKSGRQGGRR